MVKRPKSPEIIEEARYFTVCQPFPLNANWLLDDDQKDCATWIAECIGLEHLYAIHYKPSAHAMILLEVSKMFTEHERLLGEHKWSEILEDCKSEEEERVSQIFHSFYSTGREAQKDGWKNLSVKWTWFKDWSPGKGRFKKPYPPTHWCPVPVGDRTNKQLCRPLPARKIPPPPRAEQPVVGSSTWIETKTTSPPTPETLTKVWDEDVGSIDITSKLIIETVNPKANAGSTVLPMVRIPATTSTSPTTSAPKERQPNLSSLSSSQKNKKKKPIPLNQFIDRGGGGGGNKPGPKWNKPAAPPSVPLSLAAKKSPLDNPSVKPTPSANAWSKPIKLPVLPAPPKKEAPMENFSSWGKEPAASTIDQEDIWKSPLPTKNKKKGGAAAKAEASVSSTSRRSTQPSTPQVGNTRSISSPSPTTTRPYLNFRASAGSEEEEDSDDDDIYSELSKVKYIEELPPKELEHAQPDTEEGATGEGRVYGNLWLSEEDPRAVPAPEFICPTHRIACNKGICEDMAKLVRAKKLKELEAEREKNGKGKKNRDRRRKERGDDNQEESSNTAEVDGDNFTIARPIGKRRGFGKQKQGQDTREEPPHIGRMRAFSSDPPSGPAGVEVEPERELFTEW